MSVQSQRVRAARELAAFVEVLHHLRRQATNGHSGRQASVAEFPVPRPEKQDPTPSLGTEAAKGIWTILGLVTIALLAIGGATGLMLFHHSECVQKGLPPLPNLPAGSTACSAFVSEPEYSVWVMLIAAQVALALVALGPVLMRNYREAKLLRARPQGLRDLKLVLVPTGLLMGAAAAIAFASRVLPADIIGNESKLPTHWPLSHYELRTDVVVAIALVVGLAAIVGMWIEGLRADRLFRKMSGLPSKIASTREGELKDFLHLRQALQWNLTLLAAIVGLGTLSTGALRNALLAMNSYGAKDGPLPFAFDQQYVLIYGLFFTGLLAIAFLPSFIALRNAGIRIRDTYQPIPIPSDEKFSDRVDARAKLDQFLDISMTASASFKATVSILTPLATALVALLLPKFG